jgi:hypothetical protein
MPLSAIVACRAEHAHVLDVDSTNQDVALALLVSCRDRKHRRVGDVRLHRPAVRLHLHLGPVVFPFRLDFAVFHVVFQVAFHFDPVTDVLFQVAVPVEPVEDGCVVPARSQDAWPDLPIGRIQRRFRRRIDQQVTGIALAANQTS